MFLGIDLGTTSLKAVLADENGKILCTESVEYPCLYPHENWSEQNPLDWWEGFKGAVKKLQLHYDLKKLSAMSFSGQMHGLVLLDQADEVIRPAILWNDSRTIKEVDYLNNVIGRQRLVELTGNVALTGFSAPKVLWVRNNEGQNFAKISKIMLPKDYLQYKISGNFATDCSDASGTLFFDVKNKCWSQEMMQILGINEQMLPKVYHSYEVVGNVCATVAQQLGLSTDTKVVIGGGDQAMGAIGTGTICDGQVSISLGTSGVVFVGAEQYVEDKNASLHLFCHANGKYHYMGVTLSCMGSTKWWVEGVLDTKDYPSAYNGLSQLPPTNIIFLPYLMGERSPINNPFAKGTFFGLNLLHKRREMTKAVLEGVCLSLKDCLQSVHLCGIYPQCARVVGGGAKSADLLQILADVLDIEIHSINTSEGGALGAIILCMYACKKFDSIEACCQKLITQQEVYHPNKENAEFYNEKYLKYKQLYNNTAR